MRVGGQNYRDGVDAQPQGDSGRFEINTDCCRTGDGLDLRRQDATGQDQVWCFGCQWGARGHMPVDNDKIRNLTDAFMNMVCGGTTALENVANIISDLYRKTIRAPAMAAGQWLPDWPPSVVLKHIHGMTEPRVVNALMVRQHLALLNKMMSHAVRVDTTTGEESINLPVTRLLFTGMRELRELYRQVPKDSFGYNETLRADSWAGSVFVHPSRVRQPNASRAFPGAPVASHQSRIGARHPAVSSGGCDTGQYRGPANDEELARRPDASMVVAGPSNGGGGGS